MAYNNAGSSSKCCRGSYRASIGKVAICVLLSLLLPFIGLGQKGDDDNGGDEITVSLEVKGVGTADVPSVYYNNEIYLSIPAVFDLIKIRNISSPSFDSIKGFFSNELDTFLIDKTHNVIHYKGKDFDLKQGGLILSESGLYMNLKYFKAVFGLDGTFYFRRLVVTMTSEVELPVIREMRQEFMRRNISRLSGEQKADTTIGRSYPLFHFGMADWAVMATQQSPGQDQTTVNLGLGGVLAGGEANASLNYYSQQAFNEKQQYYQWRYVNNDNPALRQVVAGKIFTQATSSLYAPVVGIQFTNAPTTYRQSYGTYTLSNTTEPGWIVELYVNDVLVDYKKADASGFFTFEVPLFYGFTIVKLKFYGPYGEERTSQQYISIPFNFLPKHEMEYSASAGIVEDGSNSRFSRERVTYGLSRGITVGGGVEYLSSVTSGSTMPFVNTSVKLAPTLLFSGEYTYGVRSLGILSYRLPSNLQIDLDYTKYDPGQTAIYYNYLEERKAIFTMPVHSMGFSLFTRLTVDQIVIPTTQYTNVEWAIAGFINRVGVNLSTYASYEEQTFPYFYSILSVSVPLPAKILFTSQFQFDYKASSLVFMKYTFEKHLYGNGYFNIAFQDYFDANMVNVLVGMRYDLNFAKVSLSVLQGNNNTYSRVEAASGSLINDARSGYLNFNNRTNVGKGAIVIEPYLDLNCNGRRDPGEPMAPGLKVRINGGRVIYDNVDTTIRILDLEPYNKYYVDLDLNGFDDIAWQVKNKTMLVIANPNSFTSIEVPVRVTGEVSGMVYTKTKDAKQPKGQGQIVVCVYNDSELVARTVTESDGYFSYIGLPPGDFKVTIDSAQLHKLHLRTKPPFLPVHMAISRDGDVADGLEFSLLPEGKDTLYTPVTDSISTKEKKEITIEPKTKKEKRKTQDTHGEDKIITENNEMPALGNYTILVDVYENIGKAGRLKSRLARIFKLPVYIIQTGEDFKVEIIGFARRKEAQTQIRKLADNGFPEALILKTKPLNP